ncbi:F-box/WD repeat-containing protein 7-like [Corticium candelabrum]|uniref:F-box/WD repeat-containing protein 7-like n=1 Tax=Corticium candelabrum TaxID=121492 RepID=UPI002E26ED72|nr:F-box/WD repeat-containing protein 7-like [Corticium candelabrum]
MLGDKAGTCFRPTYVAAHRNRLEEIYDSEDHGNCWILVRQCKNGAGSALSTCKVLTASLGLCLHELKEHLGIVRCLHLTRTRLVTGGDVRKLIIWDTERGEMCNIIHRNPTSLHQMWVDDTRLITASPDAPGTITIINFW